MSVRRRNREARAAARVLPPFIPASADLDEADLLSAAHALANTGGGAVALADAPLEVSVLGARKLRYRGDCRDINSARWAGPDLLDTWWRPVFAEYDAQADETLISYTVVPRAEVDAREAFILAMGGGGIR